MDKKALQIIELLERLRSNLKFIKYSEKDFKLNLDPDKSYEIYFQYIKKKYSTLKYWKIAATSLEGQKHINVSQPLAGFYEMQNVFKNGCKVNIEKNLMRVLEPEFVFLLDGEKINGSGTDNFDFIKAIAPGFELPNSRFENFHEAGETLLIFDSACAHNLIIGEFKKFKYQVKDFDDYPVEIFGANKLLGIGNSQNVYGNPFNALRWIVKQFSKASITFNHDIIVSTGTCIDPIKVIKNTQYLADFGELGKINLFVE
jgi:2-keto-4-pentenoate hydratase